LPLPIELATKRSATAPDFEVREVARQASSEPLPETRYTAAARIKLGTPQDLRTPAGVSRLQRDDVPLLYWTVASWAGAIAANKRDLELVGDLPLIASLLDRALQLDEAWDQGALHEFAISFDPARPEGTTLQKQRQHFERARQLTKGEKISPLVTYAQAVSGPAQNKREYEALLKEAASFDVEQPKARKHRLANVLAQRRARYLLAHEDDVFPD